VERPFKEYFVCFDYCDYCEYVLEHFSRGDTDMTLPAHSKPLRASALRPSARKGGSPEAAALGGRLPSADEKADANQLRRILASQMATGAKIRVLDPNAPNKTAEITLAPALSDLMMELLRYIGKGDAVTLVPVSQMLTTQQAADVLNVSRPFLISLLDKGEIDHELVGRHRRIKAENLFAYKAERDRKRRHALSELAAIDADLI
jgi:excisionase family DNA binding protein